MSKNLRHFTSIHEAAYELHKLLSISPGYISIQVISTPETNGCVSKKSETREIVVFVKSDVYLSDSFIFNGWFVRYEFGN